jgi:hypothetical protein
MKTKTKLIATLIVVVMAFQASAQIGFGVRAGAGLFNLDVKEYDGTKEEGYKLAPRFNIGVFAEFNVSENFLIQPGLLFATKGAKSDDIELDFDKSSMSASINLQYIELPIYLMYKAQMGQGAILLGAGPYFGYGLGGKYNWKMGSVSINWDIKFSNEWGDEDAIYFKPLDYGFNVMAAYQLPAGLFFGLNAQLGLANFYLPYEMSVWRKSSSDDKSSIKNIGFNLSVGYKF